MRVDESRGQDSRSEDFAVDVVNGEGIFRNCVDYHDTLYQHNTRPYIRKWRFQRDYLRRNAYDNFTNEARSVFNKAVTSVRKDDRKR